MIKSIADNFKPVLKELLFLAQANYSCANDPEMKGKIAFHVSRLMLADGSHAFQDIHWDGGIFKVFSCCHGKELCLFEISYYRQFVTASDGLMALIS